VRDIAKDRYGKLFVSIEARPVEYDLTAIVDSTLRLEFATWRRRWQLVIDDKMQARR
jgi:hypothetical protein